MRKPLFETVDSEPLPPEARWRVAKPEEVIGRQLVLAGKPIALYTHRVGRRTWPCLRSLPMLGKECPHCERARAKKCWVPFVHLDCNPHAIDLRILMGATVLEASVKGLKPGCLIHAGRCLQLKPTWRVSLDTDQTMQPIGLGLLAKYVPDRGDITRWLLHYWQWAEVTRAFGEVYRESVKNKLHRETAESHKLSLMTGEDVA